MSRLKADTAFNGFHFKPWSSFSPKDQEKILESVKRIEKRTFPASEAFDFDSELKKKNTTMVIAISIDQPLELAAYIVYARVKRLALLHKVCVVEQERHKGLAKAMIASLRSQLERAGCLNIHLWVDEDRTPARSLYTSGGFRQIDSCENYYGPGRTALKMELILGE